MVRRALISCSDKTGLVPFARRLEVLGFEILSTGGTAKTLTEGGVRVTDVSDYTQFPEMMDGRLKTLHPRVHGGLLGRPDLPGDRQSMESHGITPIELAVVNLYPFVETISKPGVLAQEAIEQIDIGGPSMVRSAAKNHAHVLIVTTPDQYDRVATALEHNSVSLEFRRELAAAAFEMTALYDRAIADYMKGLLTDYDSEGPETTFPRKLALQFQRHATLRYGENPHQQAAIYHETSPHPATLAKAEVLHGKELSFNNYLDLDAAMQIVREFSKPAVSVIKHNNPCGCAISESISEAYVQADACDPVSAFGSILGFNRTLDLATAEELCAPGRFIEAIIAPGYEPDALTMLTSAPKWRHSVRLLKSPALIDSRPRQLEYRKITGGLLVQEQDDRPEQTHEWRVVTSRTPTAIERADLEFAWAVCKHVKSNAILLAKNGASVGVGAGQMSRLDSARIACEKAADRSRGSVAASDAFFPFRDGVDQLHHAGISAIIQPGGSKRDEEVIEACNEYGIAMIFTGRRHFRH
ncbi:Bifunctional purine biosynthesis protein PurH [Planctopirus ephydatiae]|uniref:Bifunctional purine biosynthesis protein PurH n=1 Tax=Planctopirus ephydatiae TaxID=2528019 RepID=A0A518GNI7_9PLAN|nr:bifunctional phosphoribosylaminoimidazolecarboxamide formyltransferase/IMP cyclohydrolase [Planctopirus ephydatiae]QDV30195.1 Bifunctional purine biosynthesis protein PurH [Planctopirus ephydatiae]